MKYIGAHVSTAGGVFNAPKNATEIGAKAFAIFLKNQRQWFADPYTDDEINQFKTALKKSAIAPRFVLPHTGYLINLGSPDDDLRMQSLHAFIHEIKRASQLGLIQLNFHPGHHLNLISEKKCLKLIAEAMNTALAETSGVSLIVENTSGQGSAVGYNFSHLAAIIDKVEDKKRVGVCIDTCHLFTSGFDFRDEKSYTNTWNEFAKTVGFKYLKALHLNDSKTELGSRLDRHESIGKGLLGIEAFKMLMQDQRFDDIPLILETIDSEIWAKEISMLYGFCKS